MWINKISPSKLNTFRQCKLRYRRKYVDYFVEDEGTNIEQAHFGSYVHKLLELGVTFTALDQFNKIITENKDKYKIDHDKYKSKTELCLKNFLKFNKTLTETVSTELEFEVVVDEKFDIKINGIIDRIIKNDKGEYLVIDYKTGKEKDKLQLLQDPQLKMYCYAVHSLCNVPIKNITLAHYYPPTNKLVSIKYTENQIVNFMKELIKEVWKIRKLKKNELVASENEYCNWCGYKSLCPVFTTPLKIQENLTKVKIQERIKG